MSEKAEKEEKHQACGTHDRIVCFPLQVRLQLAGSLR